MVSIPKPGYLIVKADIVKGQSATDDILEMSPAVRTAWGNRVQEFHRGDLPQSTSEEDLPKQSMLDEVVGWLQHHGKQPSSRRPFDHGAVTHDSYKSEVKKGNGKKADGASGCQ